MVSQNQTTPVQDLITTCLRAGGKMTLTTLEQFRILCAQEGAFHGIKNAAQGGFYKNQVTLTAGGQMVAFDLLTSEPQH